MVSSETSVKRSRRTGCGVCFLLAASVAGFPLAAADVTWTGAASAAWSVADNWSGGEVPAAGDSVSIPSGTSVMLAESTPALASVEIAGTLVMTNWTTCLTATEVTVAAGGKITCGAPAKTMDAMSRVWISCVDLEVVSGGAVDVSEKGYFGRPKSSGYGLGYGPGASSRDHNVGASHGGHGSFKFANGFTCDALPYDDPLAPELPGSSGVKSAWGDGGDGGGVVRISASGDVTVDGAIRADGETSSSAGTTSQFHNSSGAGGSIYITCRTISGSGTLSAVGGGGDRPSYNYPAMPAGGGCIAVHYDTAVQSAAAVAGMKITVAGGLFSTGTAATSYRTTNVTADKNRSYADIGTLYFSDEKLIDALLGKGLTGRICGVSEYVYDGDLSFTSGHVRFAAEGLSVAVTGNLVMGGSDSRLEIGGHAATNRSAFVSLYAGRRPISFTVGGDLVLGGTSRLDVRAAATNSTDVYGALTTVGGVMSVGAGCAVYAWSDPVVVSVPRFDVGGLTVAEGGLFSAFRRGGRAQLNFRALDSAYGKKCSGSGYAGSGHGGRGGAYHQNTGQMYGDAERPSLPGGGGGSATSYILGGDGGGIVYISATNGTVRIDGEINADGEAGNLWVENTCGGGGAGGTIFIEARRFIGGKTAVLSAAGGNTTPISGVPSGGGGGGRIAVWCGAPWSETVNARRVTISETPLSGDAFDRFFSWEGTVSAAGGVTLGTYADASDDGGAGTVRFCHVRDRSGLTLVLR